MPVLRSAFAASVLLTAFAVTSRAQIADFLEAARADDIPKLQKLLSDTTLISKRGEHARTALHEAAAHCRVSAARFLIEHGADLQAMNDSSATPPDLAAQCPSETRSAFQALMPRRRMEIGLSIPPPLSATPP